MAVSERLRPWAVPLAWAGLILVATTVPLPDSALETGAGPWDKVGHLVLYLGLGWTSGRALVRTGRFRAGTAVALWLGGMGFAGLDEWHQTWLAARSASLFDWSADAVGLTLGLVAVAVWTGVGPGTARSGRRTPSTRAVEPDSAARRTARGASGDQHDDEEIGADD